MKTNRLINKILVALLLMLPVFATTSCSEEDAPTYSHSLNELVSGDAGANWEWTTDQGDDVMSPYFGVTITDISDTQFTIDNFCNAGGPMIVYVSGTQLTFSGELVDGSLIKAGTGSITNGWQTMQLTFTYENEETSQDCSVTLEHKEVISKKAAAKTAK
ncbi:MAG: hypothetical protein K6F33_01470 [Bacteroidales bacterium]|nr:hypothetical protein [Bacteroidales bacterium]